MRDDQISISCTEAEEYLLPDSSDNAGEDSGRSKGDALSKEEPGHRDEVVEQGLRYSDDHPATGQQIPADNDVAATDGDSLSVTESKSRYLHLRIQETETPEEDQNLLEDVSRLLLEYRGEDDVNVEIASQGRIISMEWPLVRVDASPELERRLQELLGPQGRAYVETGISR